MILKCTFWALCLTIQICSGHNHQNTVNHQNEVGVWDDAHHLSLKVNQGVDLKWLSTDKEWVTMEMSSFTKGYVSVGFCPKWKGTMESCDIVLGWVDNQNGTAYLYVSRFPGIRTFGFGGSLGFISFLKNYRTIMLVEIRFLNWT